LVDGVEDVLRHEQDPELAGCLEELLRAAGRPEVLRGDRLTRHGHVERAQHGDGVARLELEVLGEVGLGEPLGGPGGTLAGHDVQLVDVTGEGDDAAQEHVVADLEGNVGLAPRLDQGDAVDRGEGVREGGRPARDRHVREGEAVIGAVVGGLEVAVGVVGGGEHHHAEHDRAEDGQELAPLPGDVPAALEG